MSAYEELGVSAKKEAVHAATKNNNKGLFPHAFCKINAFSHDISPFYVKISHADGAGTKSALAYMYWKETGDMSVWHGVVQDSIVMNLDDLACCGGVSVSSHLSLTSCINRNSLRIPDKVVAALIEGENIFLEKMDRLGIHITGQCGETADVSDLTRTVIVDNAMDCLMRECDVIDNGNIDEGDIIVGLASNGQATYEDSYNSGMRSNGLTLARHGVLSKEYRAKYPETFEAELGDKAYRGSKKLTDTITVETGEKIPVGKLILSPTRTYAPIVKELLTVGREGHRISGIVHNSGGGMTKVLHYLSKPLVVVKDDFFPVPPLFEMIQSETNVSWKEMYEVFNMGCGMEIYTREVPEADRIITTAKSFGVDAKVIGMVEKSPHTEKSGKRKSMVYIAAVNDARGNFSYSR